MTRSKTTKYPRASGRARPKQNRNLLYPKLMALPPLVNGFPEKMYTKLRYVDFYAITSSAGSTAKQLMNINSTYDPDQSGVGHQPLYRDTYASIYDQYAVVKATARVTFNSNATTSAMVCGVVIDDDSTTSTTITTLLEQNNGKSLLIAQSTGSLSNRTISVEWSAQQHLNIDPFTSQTYKTAVGSNPSELSTLLIYAAPADGQSTTTTVVMVELEQWVLFTELTTPVGS